MAQCHNALVCFCFSPLTCLGLDWVDQDGVLGSRSLSSSPVFVISLIKSLYLRAAQHPVFARLSVVIMLLHGSPVFLFPNSPVSPVWLTSNSLTRVTYLLPLSWPVPSWILLQNTRLTCLPTCLWSQLLLQNKPVVPFRVFTAVSTSKQSHLHYQENLGASFWNLC